MRRHARRQALLLIDLVLVAAATVFALVLRDNFEISLPRLQALLPYAATTLTVATVFLLTSGVNRAFWRFSAMADYLRVMATVFAIVVAAVTLQFVGNRFEGLPRALPVIQALLMVFLLVGARVAIRLYFTRRRTNALVAASTGGGVCEEAILVVGINPITEMFLRSIAEFASERIKVAGIVGRTERHTGRRLWQHQILGVPEDVASILKTLEVHGILVDRIVVTVAFAGLSEVAQQALLDIERTSDIQLDFFAERIGLDEGKRRMPPARLQSDNDGAGESDAFSSAELQASAQRSYFRTKRAIDFTIAAVFAVVAAPIILLIGLLVAFDVGLPMIFWQQRPGMCGRPFRLYKFRTMRSAHDQSGTRIPDEERLSPIGHFLRFTHLDELPQLYNILAGEMSFVGPRPLLPADQSAGFSSRLLVRPGLTGWAQVAGSRDISARDKAVLDIWYLRHASIALDLKVVARTVLMVVFGQRSDASALCQAWNELVPGKRADRDGSHAQAIGGVRTPHAA